jgi:DNA modification methylase
MERPIRNNSNTGQIVVDPFCGSGTTLIACERLDRTCYAVEIIPKYVAAILERWSKMTGKIPEKEDART